MKKVVIAILVIVSIFLMTGCGGNAYTYSEPKFSSVDTMIYEQSDLKFALGYKRYGKVIITGNSFLSSPQARGIFVAIGFAVGNRGKKTVEFDLSRLKLVEMNDGTQYEQEVILGFTDLIPLKKINPKSDAGAWLVFDIPEYLIKSDAELGILLPAKGFFEKNLVMKLNKKDFEKFPWIK